MYAHVSDFWDKLKPVERPPSVTTVNIAPDGKAVIFAWSDGKQTVVSSRLLRQNCPCAACVDEWTRERTLDQAKVPMDLRVQRVQPIGNYALQFEFSDSHSSGIYNWITLRGIALNKAAPA